MKTLKPKNNNIIPVKQITRDVAVFFVNIAIIIGIVLIIEGISMILDWDLANNQKMSIE